MVSGCHGTPAGRRARASGTSTVTNVDEPPAVKAASLAFRVAEDAVAGDGSR